MLWHVAIKLTGLKHRCCFPSSLPSYCCKEVNIVVPLEKIIWSKKLKQKARLSRGHRKLAEDRRKKVSASNNHAIKREILNKMDEVILPPKYEQDVCHSNVICFTETQLNCNDTLELCGYTVIQADKDKVKIGKSVDGGL